MPAFLVVSGLATPEGTLFPLTSESCGVPTVEPLDGIVGSSQVSWKSCWQLVIILLIFLISMQL